MSCYDQIEPSSAHRLLLADEVAAILRIKPKTLANWRAKRVGPPVTRFQRLILYPQALLEDWINNNTETPNGNTATQREMALSVRDRRPRMDSKHRFGGYRTQSEARRSSRN